MIEPSEGEIAPGAELTITFPDAMVNADKIDMEKQPCPFVSEPKIEGDFLWKSQTEGVFTVKAVVAGAKHRLTLVRDLKDASGKRVDRARVERGVYGATVRHHNRLWGARTSQRPAADRTRFHLRRAPDRSGRARLFSGSRFAPALSRRCHSLERRKNSGQIEAKEFKVAPRQPLPVGHTYDLIVNGLLDAKSRRPLPYLKVIPAGKATPLEVDWVGTFNSAIEEPMIRIKFNDEIDPAEATSQKINIQPLVKEMKLLASGDEIEVTGEFDLAQRYRVTMSPELKGERGYGLAEPNRAGAQRFIRKSRAFFFRHRRFFCGRDRSCVFRSFRSTRRR